MNNAHTPPPKPAPFYSVLAVEMAGPRDRFQINTPDVRIGSAVSKECADNIARKLNAHDALAARVAELEAALRKLVDRCDGEEGVRADGSNIDTLAAHAVLGDLDTEQA